MIFSCSVRVSCYFENAQILTLTTSQEAKEWRKENEEHKIRQSETTRFSLVAFARFVFIFVSLRCHSQTVFFCFLSFFHSLTHLLSVSFVEVLLHLCHHRFAFSSSFLQQNFFTRRRKVRVSFLVKLKRLVSLIVTDCCFRLFDSTRTKDDVMIQTTRATSRL